MILNLFLLSRLILREGLDVGCWMEWLEWEKELILLEAVKLHLNVVR